MADIWTSWEMYSGNKVPLLILLFHFAICHWGAPENWPESKVLHIKQNRLTLLPARSINMWERGLQKPVAISTGCSVLPSQALILDPDVYETKQPSAHHLFTPCAGI